MIKLVAFDWNGTILADTQTVVNCCNIQLKKGFKVKKTVNIKTYQELFDIPINQFFLDLGLAPKLVEEKSSEVADIFHQEYEKSVNRCRTRRGVRKTLKWLKENGIESVIVSNHIKERINEQINRLKINDLINFVCANSHIYTAYSAKGKEKRLIDYLKRKKIKHNEVLLIGDTVEEIKISRDIGAISVALTNGQCSTSRLKKANPDYLINNLGEIIDILNRLS